MSPTPYSPVHIPLVKGVGNRPLYIYASAVVLLLWAAIFGYLTQSFEFQFRAPSDVVLMPRSSDQSGLPTATTYFHCNLVLIVGLIAGTAAMVNAVLWCFVKFFRATRN